MREFKFRAWLKNPKRMNYSFTLMNHPHEPNEEVVLMQYTGLKDKNGKEIYEGDIYHMGDPNITYTVVWHDTGLIGKQNGSSSYAGLSHWQVRIEVIGNIYENPELLDESK